MAIVGILLAAGRARRFGAPKLLHPLADGVPMGVAAARTLVEALPEVIAVVRPGDRELVRALSETGLTIVENPLADEGLGTSLAAGVRASPHAAGWLIALADMPWVSAATITRLADGLRSGASIIAPAYRGGRGHPVGFASAWGDHLQRLSGDEGARGLITAHPERLVLQATNDRGVVMDLDHPEALDRDG